MKAAVRGFVVAAMVTAGMLGLSGVPGHGIAHASGWWSQCFSTNSHGVYMSGDCAQGSADEGTVAWISGPNCSAYYNSTEYQGNGFVHFSCFQDTALSCGSGGHIAHYLDLNVYPDATTYSSFYDHCV